MILRLFHKLSMAIKRRYWKFLFKSETKNKETALLLGYPLLINKKVKHGKNVCIYPDVTFFGDGEIEIGDNVNIGQGAIFYASSGGGIFIGNNSMIAAQTYIIDADHGTKAGILIREQNNSIEKVVIEDDCWIAAGAKVLKGTHLHDGCVVGAQSVVKGEFEENSIILGVPGKVVKKRSLRD